MGNSGWSDEDDDESGSSDVELDEDGQSVDLNGSSVSEDEDECIEAKGFRNSVYQLLKTAKGNGGDFAVSGELKIAPLCVIDIENYGKLCFPIYENQAKQIIQHFEQAPFGKGTETVVDRSVRNSWQLDPTKFKILNPSWDTFMQTEVLPTLVTAFEFEKTKIGASLYKFLLYEKGSFFKPHRDTEKENGMFGTLIIQLPSEYEGGNLVVKHDGKIKTIDFSSEGVHSGRAFSTFFSALYCDCEHEILPLVKGYRACLVYNLTSDGSDFVPVAPITSTTESRLIEMLKNWPLESQRKLVLVLSHKYSNAGLSFRNLKTSDKAAADLLRRVSKECSIVVALGQITKHVFGQAEDDCGEYNRYSSKRSRRELVHYTDGDQPETSYEFTVKESTCGHIEVNGLRVDLKLEVMPPSCFKNIEEPDEVNYGGYTGNCPGDLDHWYRLAALIFWPTANFLRIAQGENFSQATILSEFLKSVDAVGPDRDESGKTKIVQLCEQLLDTLGNRSVEFKDEALGLRTMWIVAEVCDLALLQRYLGKFALISPTMVPFISTQCEMYGWDALSPQLQEMLNLKSNIQAAELLKVLMGDFSNSSTQKQTTLKQLANFLLDNKFPKTDGLTSSSYYPSWYGYRPNLSNQDRVYDSDKKFFSEILLIFREMNMNIELLDFVKTKSNKQILNIVGPACLSVTDEPSGISASDPYLHPLLAYLISQLDSITSGYKEPSMARSEKIHCSCPDCTRVQAFLSSSGQSMGFKMGKDRRKHIHQRLESMQNITHETTRTGNPFTLVVTKTHVSAQAKDMTAYKELLKKLKAKFPILEYNPAAVAAKNADADTEIITLTQ